MSRIKRLPLTVSENEARGIRFMASLVVRVPAMEMAHLRADELRMASIMNKPRLRRYESQSRLG